MPQDLHESAPAPYAPAPALFPSPPRRIRLRAFPALSVLFGIVFVGVGIGAFIFLVVPFLASYAAIFIGTTSPGTIISRQITGRKARVHRIWFTFPFDDEIHHTHIDVDSASYESVKSGDPVTVRFFRLWPTMSASIEDPHLSRSWNDVFTTVITLLWNGTAIIGIVAWLRFAAQLRRLARTGMPIEALVVDKRTSESRSNTYVVAYRFHTPDGVDHESTMQLNKKDFDSLQIGQVITVLFNQEKPAENVIYRCGEYQVIGFDNKVL